METIRFALMLCLVAFGAYAEYCAQDHIASKKQLEHARGGVEGSIVYVEKDFDRTIGKSEELNNAVIDLNHVY
jgi:hypothetical protein